MFLVALLIFLWGTFSLKLFFLKFSHLVPNITVNFSMKSFFFGKVTFMTIPCPVEQAGMKTRWYWQFDGSIKFMVKK